MNKRKSICIMLIVALLLGYNTTILAYAQEVGTKEEGTTSPHYDHTMSTKAGVAFVDGIAYLTGSVSGYPGKTTKINGFLYLQHKVGSDWFIVKTWTGSVNDWTLDITGEASGLSSGTYRARFVTYVFEGSESEEVVYLSKEVVYNKK
ncbi:MAG: hypothetical protein OSJ52_02730 [Lachnospiraceae bacterium]|nr:hypothetical protein [Lachnospiraceae bacterium]